MTFAVPDIAIWFTVVGLCFYFSEKSVSFALKITPGLSNPPGEVWTYVRAMIYPFFAGVSWEMLGAFSIAANNNGTNLLFYFCEALMLTFFVVGGVMLFYLALHPIAEVTPS
jgi:hypothetical protein